MSVERLELSVPGRELEGGRAKVEPALLKGHEAGGGEEFQVFAAA